MKEEVSNTGRQVNCLSFPFVSACIECTKIQKPERLTAKEKFREVVSMTSAEKSQEFIIGVSSQLLPFIC